MEQFKQPEIKEIEPDKDALHFFEKTLNIFNQYENYGQPVDDKDNELSYSDVITPLLSEALKLELSGVISHEGCSLPLKKLRDRLMNLSIKTTKELNQIARARDSVASLEFHREEILSMIQIATLGVFRLGIDFGKNLSEKDKAN